WPARLGRIPLQGAESGPGGAVRSRHRRPDRVHGLDGRTHAAVPRAARRVGDAVPGLVLAGGLAPERRLLETREIIAAEPCRSAGSPAPAPGVRASVRHGSWRGAGLSL